MTHQLDVIALGNAIVDVLAHTDEAFLEQHGIPKGAFVLIDTAKAEIITAALNPTDQIAGGSAGNSMACLASLGGKAGFIGKVADDELGDVYRASMKDTGVEMTTRSIEGDMPTGRCLIAVTPDAERSMATYLGAAAMVAPDDVEETYIQTAAVVYFEGYQFEQDLPNKALVKASAFARAAGRKTALTLSDVGVVERNRDALLAFIKDHIDILFANEDEAHALFGNHDNAAALAKEMSEIVPFGAVTKSERGSMVFGPDHAPEDVEAYTPPQLVDTTGAGDAYAGGFLYGFVRDMPLDQCARLGSLSASEVISHMGPRPQISLLDLAKKHGLL
ncbi:adenosine kinase [Parvularcula sp. LCG005]|uniref:adenosine kinase n=1 Tax=Parvularcula sp. LCG005 TaxID=3078805 RepID=UPI002941CF6D|nr:adenosine kinase [Parvularcula sp. LCG005]WOI53547.1 adenosine kinase [Parvularcula sp. LCG005]